jgi:murein DD-endopeptidase MepM/ murein hydrolase activator NlpD
MLIVPGGRREFVSWSAPRISRENPGVAKLLGPGSCGTVMDGAVGIGAFIWPANSHSLSGYDYSASSNHRGIDISGRLGDPVYASDHGVIVYSGWNNWGYGNVIVIDHGRGWQTLYAHLSYLSVGCGDSVYAGGVIGSFGSTGNSTGPHLHFEMMNEIYGKVNPWDFLP